MNDSELPQRTRSHDLDDEAVRAFSSAVASSFKFRPREGREYGIDGTAEHFDAGGHATGLHFFCQVKGTDDVDLSSALATDIKVRTANYLRSASLPTLMVRYLAGTDQLFVRWFHQYDPYEGRGGEKTLRFRWREDDEWGEDKADKLEAEARAFADFRKASLSLPRPLYLESVGAFGLSSAEIRIALRAACSARPDVLSYQAGEAAAGEISIAIRDQEIRADLAKVTSATLHFDGSGYGGPPAPDLVAADALMMVAMGLERLGQDELVSRLASTYLLRSTLPAHADAMSALAWSFFRADRITEALSLSDALDDPDAEDAETAAFLLSLPALEKGSALTGGEADAYERVLEARIERRASGGPRELAIAYRNLAGFHRSRNSWTQAVSSYELALENDPSFAERDYFWFEYGGPLWGIAEYERAAEAYGRAIDLGSTMPLARALKADSELFAGNYAVAAEDFSAFNSEHPEDDGEYRLKERAARTIVERLGIARQVRDPEGTMDESLYDSPETPEEWAKYAERQLERDALNNSAWVNLGIADFQRGRTGGGLDCSVAAAMSNFADGEAWQRAIVAAYELGEHNVFRDLVVCGRRLLGDELIESVIAIARLPENDLSSSALATEIDAVLEASGNRDEGPLTIRSADVDGTVRELRQGDQPIS